VAFGGGQERGMRPGTLPTHQIVGFGAASELAKWSLPVEPRVLAQLRDRLWEGIRRLEGVHLNGEGAPRLPGILNVSFEGVEGESLVTALDSLAVTTGSACSSASGDPSYVLRALGRGTQLAQSSLRFSLGRATTESDIDAAIAAVQRQVTRLRAASPVGSGKVEQDTQETDWIALSPLAGRLFRTLPGVGVIAPGPGVIQGTAGSPAHEAWVRFHVQTEGGIVKAALFQAWGCPHTVAVTAWVTGQLPGRSMMDLVPGTPSAWLESLEVPMEKLGRLLVVEDALRAVFQQWKEAP
jgi:cysteine desulfurase